MVSPGKDAQATAVGRNGRLQSNLHGQVGNFPGSLQDAGDSRPQARQPIFQHVIGGALLHHGHGRIFANGAGYHDERNAQASALEQLQGPLRTELRQGALGKDEIGNGL